MLVALQSVFSVILMIGLGFGLAKARWFEGGASNLSHPCRMCAPAYMISNLMRIRPAKLLSMRPACRYHLQS